MRRSRRGRRCEIIDGAGDGPVEKLKFGVIGAEFYAFGNVSAGSGSVPVHDVTGNVVNVPRRDHAPTLVGNCGDGLTMPAQSRLRRTSGTDPPRRHMARARLRANAALCGT